MMTQSMEDPALEQLHTAICEALVALDEQSGLYGGRARILFYAAGAFLRERGILEHLDAAGAYLQESPEK